MFIDLLHVHAPELVAVDDDLDQDALGRGAASSGQAALRSAGALLERKGIPCTAKAERGYVASTVVVAYATDNHCDGIIMGTRGMGSTEELLGSITSQVIHLASVPVTLVK